MPARSLSIGARTFTLDARPDRLDLRDLRYQPTLGHLAPRLPDDARLPALLAQCAQAGLVLDQGEDGACTGFALAAVINHLRFLAARERGEAPPPRVSPAMLYRLARLYDEWPGEDYEGSSCRGALKGWHRHGVCREALWPAGGPLEHAADRDDPLANWDVDALGCTLGVYYRVEAGSVVCLQAALRDTGAVYACGTVHEGWAVATGPLAGSHAELPAIAHIPEPRQPGVHAYALVGYDEAGFIVQNSWGTRWGAGGYARLPYEAWVAHGEDAWVFTLGVPRRARPGVRSKVARSPRHRLATAGPAIRPVATLEAAPHAREDAWGSDAPEAAAGHMVVLDRGFAIRRDITAIDAAQCLARAAFERPLAWLRTQRTRKLLVYVHGGLNSEAAALARTRQLAPHALAHGIYPLFLAWRTGPLETVGDLVQETLLRATGSSGEPHALPLPATGRDWLGQLGERTDRLLETLLRPPGLALWGQMKLNAERASHHGEGGVRALVAHWRALHAQLPGGLELHLAGHSAGAIVIGAMLGVLRDAGLRVHTLRLLAPACTTRFALDTYAAAVRDGTLDARHWHLHLLSHANELRDHVGPYRKSLLLLVSRAFEERHKTPLLGLEASFDARTARAAAADGMWSRQGVDDVAQWLDFWRTLGTDATHRHVLRAPTVSTGAGRVPASHGCFDNAVDLMGDLLGGVKDPQRPSRLRIARLDD
jgi:hypothetical protein